MINRVFFAGKRPQGPTDAGGRPRIHLADRVVEYQDGGVIQQGPGQCHPLFLSTGQDDAFFTHHRFEPEGQFVDGVVKGGQALTRRQVGIGHPLALPKVMLSRTVPAKRKGSWGATDNSDAQVLDLQLADVGAIDAYLAPTIDIVKPHQADASGWFFPDPGGPTTPRVCPRFSMPQKSIRSRTRSPIVYRRQS
jgi:hypothetical protein